MTLELSVSVQNNRKAIIIRDTSDQFDELGNPEGWGTEIGFSEYSQAGNETATLTVTKDHYNGNSETEIFDLTALGFFEDVTDQSELIFNLVEIDGELSLVSVDDFDSDEVSELPDGLYTLVYNLTTPSGDIEYVNMFVLNSKAESILEGKSLNLDTKIFSSNSVDLVQIIDIVILEAMLFIINKSKYLGKKDIILRMLKIINNEEYEYYRD